MIKIACNPCDEGHGSHPAGVAQHQLEFWNDAWWRWVIVEGKPIAFVKLDPQPDPPVMR